MKNFQEIINIEVECPHCNDIIIIKETSLSDMRFFRHGIYKNTGKWINPYMSDVICDRYLLNKKIIGCGKFLKIIYDGTNYQVDKTNN
jgi:hypothetical protein